MMQGTTIASQLFPQKLLPQQVEFLTYTEDGSQTKTIIPAREGMVTDHVTHLAPHFDQIFACGPGGMYHSLKTTLESIYYENSVQISLDIRMGCGLGACYGCSVHTKHGMKKVCQNGPIFELSDFTLEDLQKIKIWP
jgi:dihydroorotate dehydrogenase electron transfer subunit